MKNSKQLSMIYRIFQFIHLKQRPKDKNNLDIFFCIGFMIFNALLFTFNLYNLVMSPPFIMPLLIIFYYIGKFVARLEIKAAETTSHEI